MKTQSGQSSLPAILLTFSLLLLVLAIGFVVGRVVVARAYLDTAPRFETEAASASGLSVPEGGLGESAVPGRVYVPPPAPPPTPPDGEPLLESAPEGGPQTDAEQQDEAAADSTGQEESRPDERPPARDEGRAARTPQPAPQPSPEPRPRARPQPRPAPPPAEPAATYSLQVGVFTSLQGARQVVDELARTGYPARIVPEKRGSQELYRVLTGRYQTEYAARKALDRLRADGFEGFLVEE